MTALTLQIRKASGLPFYRQVIDQIAALIRSGQLPPGARLPRCGRSPSSSGFH